MVPPAVNEEQSPCQLFRTLLPIDAGAMLRHREFLAATPEALRVYCAHPY
jgi:hypothetical protein